MQVQHCITVILELCFSFSEQIEGISTGSISMSAENEVLHLAAVSMDCI